MMLEQGGPANDQLWPFRNETIASTASTDAVMCTFLPLIPFSYIIPDGLSGVQSLTCSYKDGALIVNISIDGKIFGLQATPLRPLAEIVSYNLSWSTHPVYEKVSVDVLNVGNTHGNFSLWPLQCCVEDSTFGIVCQGIQGSSSGWLFLGTNQNAVLDLYINITGSFSDLKGGGCDYSIVEETIGVQSYIYFEYQEPIFNNSNLDNSPTFSDTTNTGSQLLLTFVLVLRPNQIIVNDSILVLR
jgi:hypothetical protein